MTLTPRSSFAGLHLPSNATSRLPLNTNHGVIVSERDGLGIATVLVRKHQDAALAQCLRKNFGLELPQGLQRRAAGDIALLGTAPGTWLAIQECAGNPSVNGGNACVIRLRQAISQFACVSDQSDGYAVLRLSGSKVRETLGKLVPVDMHPRAFKVGDVRSTVAGHMGVTLWRLEDTKDGAYFEIALYRSFSKSFWHALSGSAAEFGQIL